MNASPLYNQFARLDWSTDDQPRSVDFDDIYFTSGDALAESDHVFAAGNRLTERWQRQTTGTFCIAELGFGTGLNFLNSWHHWRSFGGPCTRDRSLHYIGLEQYPLTVVDIARVHACWPALSDESVALLRHYPRHFHSSGWHRLHLDHQLTLDLYLGDAREQLATRSLMDRKIDAWFVDGFSPGRNPALWEPRLLQLIAAHSRIGTTLTTYSAAGQFRRDLAAAGFRVSRKPGFGSKRHMLSAELRDKKPPTCAGECIIPERTNQPWFGFSRSRPQLNKAIVIGAGLAGAHCAAALARRHWQVTVLERSCRAAAGASGIRQLALRLRAYRQANREARFYLQAYLQAVACYASLGEPEQSGWHASGVLQLPGAVNQANGYDPERLASGYADALVRLTGQQEFPCHGSATASGRAVARQLNPGKNTEDAEQQPQWLWFPLGGWAEPVSLCRRLLSNSSISLLYGKEAISLVYRPGEPQQWQVLGLDDEVLASAPAVIIATGECLGNLDQTRDLPLLLSPGQSTLISQDPSLDKVDYVVTGERSLLPPLGHQRTLSASYRAAAEGMDLRPEDDEKNLAAYRKLFPSAKQPQIIGSQLAVRASTPDRLPLVGPVPDIGAMRTRFAALSRNARQPFKAPGCYYRGLYISAAHGSSGLCTTPICAEYLASLISSECLPLNQPGMNLLNPVRFVIRELKKQHQ